MRAGWPMLVLAALTLAGCKRGPAGAGSPAGQAEARPAPGNATASVSRESICDSPSLEKIPAGPVRGQASGKPFVARSVFFEPGLKEWRLVIHESVLATPTALSPAGQHLNINLPEVPAAGKRWSRAMKYGDGYFQIRKPDDPSATTSWNGSNAWAIEITRWEVRPHDEKGPAFQEAGRASGRIAICYQGGGSFKDSWAAGTFEDAVVRYMGKPYWLKQAGQK